MTGDDHVALAGALVLAYLAIREARRYLRKPPPVTPLVPEVRPESYAEHADQAIAVTRELDPVAVQWDALHAEAVEFAAEVMATIDALCDPEVAE